MKLGCGGKMAYSVNWLNNVYIILHIRWEPVWLKNTVTFMYNVMYTLGMLCCGILVVSVSMQYSHIIHLVLCHVHAKRSQSVATELCLTRVLSFTWEKPCTSWRGSRHLEYSNSYWSLPEHQTRLSNLGTKSSQMVRGNHHITFPRISLCAGHKFGKKEFKNYCPVFRLNN